MALDKPTHEEVHRQMAQREEVQLAEDRRSSLVVRLEGSLAVALATRVCRLLLQAQARVGRRACSERLTDGLQKSRAACEMLLATVATSRLADLTTVGMQDSEWPPLACICLTWVANTYLGLGPRPPCL